MSSALTPLESHYCRLCNTSTPTRSAWVSHLASSPHQMLMKKGGSRKKGIIASGTDRWDRHRSLKISDCSNHSLVAIVEYLDSWGPVENFCHLTCRTEYGDTELSACYVLMKSSATAHHLVFRQEPHRVPPTGETITISKWTGKKSKAALHSKLISGSYSEELDDEPELQPLPAPPEPEGPQPNVPFITGKFVCSACSETVTTLSNWVVHLCSDGHRKLKNNSKFGIRSWDCSKGLGLTRVKGCTKLQILEWAISWGPVSDFIYAQKDSECENVWLLFEVGDIPEKIIRFKDYHIIADRRVEANLIPEFCGYSKAEKLMLKAEKLASEMVSIASTSAAIPLAVPDPVDDDSDSEELSVETERKTLLDLLNGKPLEEQFFHLLNHSSWPDPFYKSVDRFVQDVLIFMVRRLGNSLSNTCELLPFGQYGCRTGLNKKRKPGTVHLLVNVQNLGSTPPIDINQYSVQVDLIHKLRQGIESSVNLVPGSIHALPFDKNQSNRPCIAFSTATEPPMDFLLKIESDNPLAAQEAAAISYYCTLDPRVKTLLQIIHQWGELNKLMSSCDELFPHHLLSWLVIFYLVHKQILPSLHQICKEDKDSSTTPILVQGYDISFPKSGKFRKSQPELADPSILALSVTSLLKDFFNFYGYVVDIYNNVFCLRFGSMISKVHFFSENRSNLPIELQEASSRGGGQLYSVSSLVVQDAFVLSMNLFKNRGKKPVFRFVGCCRRAFHLLEAGFNEEHPSLEAIFLQKPENSHSVTYLPKF